MTSPMVLRYSADLPSIRSMRTNGMEASLQLLLRLSGDRDGSCHRARVAGKSRGEQGAAMTEIRYRRFGDFYPFYLTEHANRLCRRMHFIGSTLVLCALAAAVA